MSLSVSEKKISQLRLDLLAWYQKNHRKLPWRENRDPYRIWISEVMLQQTTVAAVIPYFNRFIERFPTIKHLATSSLEDVYEQWAGLGYYSRARNLHKSAQALLSGWPRSHSQLIELPGFGPYTARAVSSLAFDEPVGVVDGNVIRVLSRVFDLSEKWWTTQGRNQIQQLSDHLANESSFAVNQALMEVGATICTPKSPTCTLCPWLQSCRAKKSKTVESRPLTKPKRKSEFWTLYLDLPIRSGKIGLVDAIQAPFLKSHKLPPLLAKRVLTRPNKFNFKHTITHHNIYVTVLNRKTNRKNLHWVNLSDLKKSNPSSLLQKALDFQGRKK